MLRRLLIPAADWVMLGLSALGGSNVGPSCTHGRGTGRGGLCRGESLLLLATARSVGLASGCSAPRNTTSNSVKIRRPPSKPPWPGILRPCWSAKPPRGSTRSRSSPASRGRRTARVIVLGNKPTVEAAVAAIKEGAADYLHEPCSAEELRAALRRIETAAPTGPRCRRGGSGRGLPRL